MTHELKTQTRTTGQRWLLGCGGALLLAVGVITLAGWLLGLRVVFNPPQQLTHAQTRWDTAAITGYTLTVEVLQPFGEDVVYEFTVMDGNITEAVQMNPGVYRYDATPPRFEIDPSQVTSYTVEGLFNRAARITEKLPAMMVIVAPTGTHIRYNANDGYPEYMLDNRCGLLFSSVNECLTQITVLAFKPEPSPQR